MYGRPTDVTERWIEAKFGGKPEISDANVAAFNAGYNFGETTELFDVSTRWTPATASRPAPTATSTARPRRAGADRRQRRAAGCRCSTRATRSRPASELLHELSRHKTSA